MAFYSEGIVEQVYLDSEIIVISVDYGNKRITVKSSECLGILKEGDFVLYENGFWYKNPRHEILKTELNKKIQELYHVNIKK